MSELSWLLDLLLNHNIDDKTKKHVGKRIAFVEKQLNRNPAIPQVTQVVRRKVNGAEQAPSTIAAMERHSEAQPQAPIATSPMAQAALATRQAMIDQALSGKEQKGLTSPNKFRGPLK